MVNLNISNAENMAAVTCKRYMLRGEFQLSLRKATASRRRISFDTVRTKTNVTRSLMRLSHYINRPAYSIPRATINHVAAIRNKIFCADTTQASTVTSNKLSRKFVG